MGGPGAGGLTPAARTSRPNSLQAWGVPLKRRPRPTTRRTQGTSASLKPERMQKETILTFKGHSYKVLSSPWQGLLQSSAFQG